MCGFGVPISSPSTWDWWALLDKPSLSWVQVFPLTLAIKQLLCEGQWVIMPSPRLPHIPEGLKQGWLPVYLLTFQQFVLLKVAGPQTPPLCIALPEPTAEGSPLCVFGQWLAMKTLTLESVSAHHGNITV